MRDDDALLAGYVADRAKLTHYLTRRTGCAATAEDLAQDVWLRAQAGGAVVIRPGAFLRRIAANLATDHARSAARRLTVSEVDALLEAPDDRPTPEASALARAEVRALSQALNELPERCRAIFLAARVENLPHREIAQRHGLSTRTIEMEVRRALAHCAARLGRPSAE